MIDRQPFTLRELLLYFLRLGTTGFGGPASSSDGSTSGSSWTGWRSWPCSS